MRVNLLNPVQQVLASVSYAATAGMAKKAAAEHEEKQDERHAERMDLEKQKLQQRQKRDVIYERDVGVRETRAGTEAAKAKEEIARSKQQRRILNKQIKMQEAADSLEDAMDNDGNAKGSVDRMKNLKRVDGVIDFRQFKKED